MFKNLFASLAVAVCTFGAAEVPGAQAATNYCYTNSANNTMCIHAVYSHKTRGGAQKLVVSSINGGPRYKTEVDCTTASPSNYKANLAGIACYEFN